MSEELMKEDNNLTMADLEDHFDDANPWNVVKRYLEKKTILPVKIEGIVNRWSNCYGRRTARIHSGFQIIFILH